MFHIPYKKINIHAQDPTRANEGDAGLDLFSSSPIMLYPGVTEMLETGIKVAIPFGYCGLILPRSSMGRKGIIIPNSPGLIDSGYRGEIKVLLLNVSNELYKVEVGDKIAQLVIVQHERATLQETEKLPASFDERGVGGFGSSGK